MQRACRFFLIALALATSCSLAQSTGARATPQTQSSAPAAVTGSQTPQLPADRGVQRGGVLRGARNSRTTTQGRTRPPAPAANSTIGIIGGTSAPSDSAVLPGVRILHNALGIAAGTPISVRLQSGIDSGQAHNGDTVRGVLAAALGRLPMGSPVNLTVVAAAAAGQLSSGGVLSLQVVSINGEPLLSQVLTAEGKEGAKELPDAAPARGTEAEFTPDVPLTLPAA